MEATLITALISEQILEANFDLCKKIALNHIFVPLAV